MDPGIASGFLSGALAAMFRGISVVILMILAAPSHATETPAAGITAQQQQAPQQAPKRDCEKKQDEGVSA